MKVTERWTSDRMGREVTLARWGHYGVPVLLFPTAGGDAEEVERQQLIAHLGEAIEGGRIKVYSVDSTAGRAMVAREGSPEHRIWLLDQFHETIAHEVVPAIHADCGAPLDVVAAGASIGAFNALASVCRSPHLFRAAICMSGSYHLEKFIEGPTDELHHCSPVHFVPELQGARLEQLRRRFVVLASGSGRWEDVNEAWTVASVLGGMGIPNRVDDWGECYDHDWPTWWEMLPVYLAELGV